MAGRELGYVCGPGCSFTPAAFPRAHLSFHCLWLTRREWECWELGAQPGAACEGFTAGPSH